MLPVKSYLFLPFWYLCFYSYLCCLIILIVFKFIFVRPRSGRSRHQLLAAAQVPSQVCPLHLLCNASNICICFSICNCICICIFICVLSKAESRLCIQNILYLCLCVFCATLQTFVFALFGFSFEFAFVCRFIQIQSYFGLPHNHLA